MLWFDQSFTAALGLSVASYALIGLGVGAAGTSVLALLATATEPHRRAAAATITWLMMIGGIAVTATLVGIFLDPYSPGLLLEIVVVVTLGAFGLSILAIWGIERGLGAPDPAEEKPRFAEALREVWRDPQARGFTIFVFLSMVAYFMQELIMEPFAGLVFGLTPGQSTRLSGAQNAGVFLGMLIVGVAATGLRFGTLRVWVMVGCAGSAVALTVIGLAGLAGLVGVFVGGVITLGVFNGAFAVAAVGAMIALAADGPGRREGMRMGLWGAAQAIAAGGGGFVGAAAADIMRRVFQGDVAAAFGCVFAVEAALFVIAAILAVSTVPDPR